MSRATPAITRIWLVSRLSWRVSGVTSSSVTWSMPLMCPTSVAMPVLVTSSVPAPRVTCVFMKARSIRSPSAASAATASTCFGTGTLSPVRADSSISSVAAVSNPTVGGDEVARLDVDDVAGHELLHRERRQRSVAADLRVDHHHLLERRDAC